MKCHCPTCRCPAPAKLRQPTLRELRVAATRAFDRGAWVDRKPYAGDTGETLTVHSVRLNGICRTILTVEHKRSTRIARERLLTILTVFGDRKEATLSSGNVYSWSKP